ncbi:serine hydrolase domain-containing protein [Algoriphagus aquimarinus]|uniref:Beta-lactamase family protein n=1 Tax=Algoriphagus aquimarinus TaxID=237018 RepID=A0A5C7AHX0_9BACT|nr:serine hydrolase domain-containing protein [Algoriphagus aquimarinus]TXE07584.1 beta-lactamase family protein [Algoriphagus aquimarinus]
MKKIIAILCILISGFNSFGQVNPNEDLERKIDQLFESYTAYNRFIGNVLISENNEIIYQKSFGYADFDKKIKNTQESIFGIASLTKSLTAIGIMKLVEEGKLTLETPLSSYFPDFIPEYSKLITIQHLLNNSSGMQANIGRIDDAGNGLMPATNEVTLDSLLDVFKDSQLNFEPGTAYEYNNFGYLLLASIIEKVSGQSYEVYMQQNVFNPAGMGNTFSNSSGNLGQRAYPYFGLGMDEIKKFESPYHSSWLKGAADMYSTTDDLYRFMQALEDGSLLKPTSVNELYSATQEMGVNTMASGLGWVIDQKEGEKWVYNSGLLPGYAAIMGSLPEKNIKIIILSNATSVNPVTDEFQGKMTFVEGEITDKIIALLLGKPIELSPLPKQNNRNFTQVNKEFQLDDEHTLVLKSEDNTYYLETVGEENWSVFTYSFSRDAKEDNKTSEIALFFAKAFSTQQFEGLSEYGNDQMKAFLGTAQGQDQLKGMWANFVNHAGEFRSYNIYKIEGDEVKNVHVRFHFETIDIGMVLSINAADKIQGMFMDDAVKTSHISKVVLVQTGDHEFFIDGHRNGGMQDLRIIVSDTELILIDGSERFIGKIQSSN